MTIDESTRRLARTLRAFQDRAQQAGSAASASYSLIGAIVLFGGIGYALDAWLGTSPTLVLIGLLVGVATGFYLLVTIGTRR
jgi:F0F1-type ATP synthase assembly protein I